MTFRILRFVCTAPLVVASWLLYMTEGPDALRKDTDDAQNLR